MIFITLGSQKFQFNRLLEKVDELIEKKEITCEVFAQIGSSDYIPKYYKYKDFLNRSEFQEKMCESNLIITHGGTGAIIAALKNKKKVIAIPRLKIFGEHVDNHQLEIVKSFYEANLIEKIDKIDELGELIKSIDKITFKEFKSNNENFIRSIENILNN